MLLITATIYGAFAMLKENVISKCLYGFGAGIAVGFSAGIMLRSTFPTTMEIGSLVLQKLGFEFGDVLLLVWDPEAEARQAALSPPMKLAALPTPGLVSAVRKRRKAPLPRRKGKNNRLAITRRTGRAPAYAA